MIEKTLGMEAAMKIFEENSIVFKSKQYIPDYRVYELFGLEAARHFMNRCKHDSFKGVIDFTWIDNDFYLFTITGFLEFAAFHNFSVITTERSKSQIMTDVDKMYEERRSQILKEDEEGKREDENNEN